MLEKMGAFFDARLDIYEDHMLMEIASADIFYPFTASCLPLNDDSYVLDLGCGTGLELNYYFKINPSARVLGIDLAEGMLATLKKKFHDKKVITILGSYFDVSFGSELFDAAVSVESLHHFTQEKKIELYTKLCNSLKEDGYFILTDYFASSDEEELKYFEELSKMKMEQNITDDEFYHYDTPLSVEHEKEILLKAGFSSVEVLNNWGATYTLKAFR